MPSNSLDSSLNAINSITRKYYFKELVDEVSTSMPLLLKLKGKMETIDGGDDIRVPVSIARFASRGWYQGDEALPVASNDKVFNLIFPWAQYNVSIPISNLNKLKNAGSAKVIDHVKSEMDMAKRDVMDAFGTGLYSAGTDAKSIYGARCFLSTSATYGGVSMATESWLQSKIDATTTVTSLAKIQERYEAASEPPIKPNFITCTETIFNSYMNLLTPIQRYTDSKLASAGFENVLFRGAPVVEDSYCPSAHMIMWNLDYFNIYSQSSRQFPGEFIDFVTPTNQDAAVAHILWMGAAICKAPRFHGALTALTS
jgi:hypothetical protein